MEDIYLKYRQRFNEVLAGIKQDTVATREEIENTHRFLDTLAIIKQHTTATQKDIWELEGKIRRLSHETTHSINNLAEIFLIFVEIGYLKFP